MNRLINILILLVSVWSGIEAQGFVDTMYFDQGWEQTQVENASYYRIISTSNDESFMFKVEDYYLSGQIQMTGTYKSIRPDYRVGTFTYWYENGNKQAQAEYSNNVLNGPYLEWYENGQLRTKQNFLKDQLNGTYQSWTEDGITKLDIQYSNGKKHGDFISFYPNGNPVRKDLYEHDEIIEGRCFDEEGDSVDYFPYIQMPAYRGGIAALRKYLKKELEYPDKEFREGIEGMVIVRFTVDEKGKVRNPEIIRSENDNFDKEALRLVSSFPEWLPGAIDGNPAPIQVSLPVEFILDR